MFEKIPAEVTEAFIPFPSGLSRHSAKDLKVEPVDGGLINGSYKLSFPQQPDIFLQRINKNVFKRPQDVQENYIRLWEHAAFGSDGLQLPAPVYCDKKASIFIDRNKNYWRAFEFIPDAKTILVVSKPTQARAVAKAFARFCAAFNDFNVELLKETIPHFHDLAFRFEQFEESLGTEHYERMAHAMPLIEQLKERERYKHFYEIITASGEFPRRVTHHDAKIANILFHRQTGRVICPVDLDTVMPGYFFSDLGDMIRSMAGSVSEETQDEASIFIRPAFYEAIITGYLSVAGKQMTASEKKYIHCAGLLMIYMQALRFMTDFLNGDKYYQVSYRGQNFDRAANQLALLRQLEVFLAANYSFSI